MALRSLGRAAVALVVPLLCGGLVTAGDGPAYQGAPVGGGMPCTNCGKVKAEVGSDCPTCVNGKYGIGWRKRPTVPTLVPGACFGYFPTQWSKWQDICPLPYPGAGVVESPTAPRKPTPPAIPPATLPGDTPPSDAEPKKKDGEPGVPEAPPPAEKGGKPVEPPKDGGLKPADPPKGGDLPKLPEPPKGGELKPADPKAGGLPKSPDLPPIPTPPVPPGGKFNP